MPLKLSYDLDDFKRFHIKYYSIEISLANVEHCYPIMYKNVNHIKYLIYQGKFMYKFQSYGYILSRKHYYLKLFWETNLKSP